MFMDIEIKNAVIASGRDISPVIINSVQFNYWKDTLPFYYNYRKGRASFI